MSVIKFSYLSRKRALSLIIILTLTSTLFSVTAYSFVGFYNGFTNFGEQDDVAAVYSRRGSTPFTGIVPLALTDNITRLQGVKAVSPEVIAPCTINGHSVFIRGVMPNELQNLNPLTFLSGQNLNLTDTNQAIVGKNLADKLHLTVGDKILAVGVMAKRYMELTVSGIFESDSTLNDEALVSIYVGQWLRGLRYNEATVIRVKVDPAQSSAAQIYQALLDQNKPSATALPSTSPSQAQRDLQNIIPLIQSNLNMSVISVEQSQKYMQNYLERYGISKDTLIALSVMVLVFASSTATVAVSLFVKQHAANIAVIRSIGATEKKVRLDLALKMVVWALLATLIGTIVSAGVIMGFQNFV